MEAQLLSLPMGVALAVSVGGMWLFWHGHQRRETPQRIAGLIIALAPLLIHKPQNLLGFIGGVALGLWMYLRVR